ncbi:MAG: ABC transporter permease [Anaerolineales bacterium]|nr:ABC transporter permease [Anaerolineales bacterium]
MTATETSASKVKVRASAEERRAKIVGLILIVLAVFVFWVFGMNVLGDLDATFKLALPTDRFQDINLTINTRTIAFVVAGILAFLGGMQLRRSNVKRTNLMLAVGLIFFAFAFLAWAAAGKSFSLVGMLRSTVILSVPVTLGALTGIMCERVAIINIGIEGQLLGSAFAATILGSAFGLWAGVFGALAVGALLGAFLAWLTIRFRVDQIIAGVVINIFALGMTSFLSTRILGEAQDLNAAPQFASLRIPILADIPLLGSMFFNHNFFVYATFLLVVLLHLGFFYTRWGLRSRSVGEHPRAADTAGINVFRTRYRNVILGGLIAGFGGAFLSLTQVSRFEENMTAGIGFIGLAAMIFGRWMPFGALAAGLVFGFARALQQKLGILATPIPSEFLLMIPYLVTIIVVAGLAGKAVPPAADGQPYIKE